VVGPGAGELAPGGEFLVVVGEAGVEAAGGTSDRTLEALAVLDRAVGDRGGRALLVRAGPVRRTR